MAPVFAVECLLSCGWLDSASGRRWGRAAPTPALSTKREGHLKAVGLGQHAT
jgi:hypothetical protein